jgi:hypothetical protein
MIRLGAILLLLALGGVFLSVTIDWKAASNALVFPLGFLLGLMAGLGSTFSIAGLNQFRKLACKRNGMQ